MADADDDAIAVDDFGLDEARSIELHGVRADLGGPMGPVP
jgi:hypothetical protein